MDTKFAVALHILIYISETDKVVSSENLARSVHTNSSHIRKIIRLLKKEGLIDSRQGQAGFELAINTSELGLDRNYRAVYPEKILLSLHPTSNLACPVGCRIHDLVSPVFEEAEAAFMEQLAQQTLGDMIQHLYQLGEKNLESSST